MSDRSRWDPEMAAFTAEQEEGSSGLSAGQGGAAVGASPPGQRPAGHADGRRRPGDGGDDGSLGRRDADGGYSAGCSGR